MYIYEESVAKVQAFLEAVRNIDPTKISVDYMLETIKSTENQLVTAVDQTNILQRKIRLGFFWVLTMASIMSTKLISLTGRWESVLWTIIDLVSHWWPGYSVDLCILIPEVFKPYILRILTDDRLCPNPFLRLEMLRIISMWPEEYMEDANSRMQVVNGLVATGSYLELHHLEPNGAKITLLYVIRYLLLILQKHGNLDAVAAAATRQVKCLKPGSEVVFLNRIVQLMGQKAEALREKYLNYHEISRTITSFSNIYFTFDLLVSSLATSSAYKVPGLAESAASSLVTVTDSLVALSSRLQQQDAKRHLFTSLDNIYKTLHEKSTPVSRVLRQNHAQVLSSLNKQGEESGFCFNHFPTPVEESTVDCPERFVDSVTGAVMEAPVLLHSSKMVVDESTLILLLLTSHPSDPFTRCPLDHGSYTRLPDLQADIVAWKNSTIGVSNGESYVNSDTNNDYEMTRENDSVTRKIVNFDVYMYSTDVDINSCQLRKLLLQFSNPM